MSKKTIQIKEIDDIKTVSEVSKPQRSDEEIVEMLTELADFYGIDYELKINKKMTKKKSKVNDLVDRESQTDRIAELFKQEMEKSPKFKEVTKFLWLPKSINGEWKWLINASWQEQFVEVIDQESLDMGSINCLVWTWKPVKWL